MPPAAKPRARVVRPGEALAIHPDALRSGLRSGRHAMWWDWGGGVAENERIGDVAIVTVSDPLEYRDGWGDNYVGIIERIRTALYGEDVVERAKLQNRVAKWNDDVEEVPVPSAEPPKAVVLRLDSPGGVVAGLFETVKTIRAMVKAAKVPLIAYADELAASAAYALACACDEIYLPRSGIVGSVGVISTMADMTKADKKFGLNFVAITSGKRKADGHPHVPLSDDAIREERGRVQKLAGQFFGAVSKARGLSVDAIRGLEAGIFLGPDAVRVGLADGVASFAEVVGGAGGASAAKSASKAKPRARLYSASLCQKILANRKTAAVPSTPLRRVAPKRATAEGDSPMIVKLAAIVAKLSAEYKAAPAGPKKTAAKKKLAAAQADLEAATKIKHKIEEYTEESDEGEEEAESAESEDEGGEDEGGDEGEEEEAAAEGGEGECESEDEGEDASAALVQLAERATKKKGKAAVAALSAVLSQAERNSAAIAQITAERTKERREALVSDALNRRAIVPHEAKTLRGKPLAFVKDFLDMRRNAKGQLVAVVHSNADAMPIPDPNAKSPEAGSEAGLPADVVAAIDLAVRCCPNGIDPVKLRADMVAAHHKRLGGANGAASSGRY